MLGLFLCCISYVLTLSSQQERVDGPAWSLLILSFVLSLLSSASFHPVMGVEINFGIVVSD